MSVPNRESKFPDLDMACFGLREASVDRRRGTLWARPDADAGSIMDWFGEVAPHLDPDDVDGLVEYGKGRTEHVIAANWKIVVENYIDGCHLGHLHSGALATPSAPDRTRVVTRTKVAAASSWAFTRQSIRPPVSGPGEPAASTAATPPTR